jgi:type II secretory pathway pseudopilin PulG
MRNRLKGVTLIETMLYIGLFSVIIIIVLNFMLSTQEATQRTDARSNISNISNFISQHINYSFNKALSVDQGTSIFDSSQGLLALQFPDGNKQYTLSNSRIYFDGIPITPSNTSVASFTLHPVYRGLDTIIGVKIDIDILSNKNPSITDTINLLLILR